MKRPFPQVERVGQNIGLAAERQFFLLVPPAREFEGIAQTALDSAPGVDAFLNRHLVRRALEDEPTRAGVEALVIFADDDEINVFRFLVLQRAESLVVELDRPQVDVLLEVEPQAQQDSLLENAGLHVGMADGAQQNGGKLSQLTHDAVRQRLLGAQVTLAAEVVVGIIEFQREFLRRGVQDLDGLAHDFRAGPVPANDSQMVAFHELILICPPVLREGGC